MVGMVLENDQSSICMSSPVQPNRVIVDSPHRKIEVDVLDEVLNLETIKVLREKLLNNFRVVLTSRSLDDIMDLSDAAHIRQSTINNHGVNKQRDIYVYSSQATLYVITKATSCRLVRHWTNNWRGRKPLRIVSEYLPHRRKSRWKAFNSLIREKSAGYTCGGQNRWIMISLMLSNGATTMLYKNTMGTILADNHPYHHPLSNPSI